MKVETLGSKTDKQIGESQNEQKKCNPPFS